MSTVTLVATAKVIAEEEVPHRPGSTGKLQMPVYAPTKTYPPEAIALGKKLYREGILASGKPITGLVSGDVPVQGTQLACIGCHKRSGFGTVEGNVITPQITADVLFSPVTSRASEITQVRHMDEKIRSAYDETTLARAIREGLNPDGHKFDALMPKYPIGQTDVINLIAYLTSLRSAGAEGVTNTDIYVTTVMSDNVDMERRRAVLRVLYDFIEDWNTDTRPRTRRAAYAPWHMKWKYESHRTWKIKPWLLEGPEETWFSQLELLHAQRPVFVVIGGIVDGSWDPVNRFCEQYEVPCIFPNTNLPTVDDDSHYSVFFSKGLHLDGEVLARFLKDASVSGQIVQIHDDSATGTVPAAAMQGKLGRQTTSVAISIADRSLAAPDINRQEILDASSLVLWLSAEQVRKLPLDLLQQTPAKLYLTASLLGSDEQIKQLRSDLGRDFYVVYPYNQPEKYEQMMRATRTWLNSKNIKIVDERLQANTFFAATLASRAIKHLGSNFSKDYLIERIEHLEKNMAVSPVYPRLTLGVEQHFASKGAYVSKVVLDGNNLPKLDFVSDWVIP